MTSNKNICINILKAARLDTPLGPIIAIANEQALYRLGFADSHRLEHEIAQLQNHAKSVITYGKTPPIISIEAELKAYFNNELMTFQTPLCLVGSAFQKHVWDALRCIPHGETRSYAEQAQSIGRPSAYRAVANANGANKIAIVIPCHRVITSSGDLGGYSSGITRKKWLLQHEKQSD